MNNVLYCQIISTVSFKYLVIKLSRFQHFFILHEIIAPQDSKPNSLNRDPEQGFVVNPDSSACKALLYLALPLFPFLYIV